MKGIVRGIKPLKREICVGKVWKIVKGIFWVVIILASLFIIFTSLNISGYQMFVVKSGSMEPKIHTGSIVLDHKEDSYEVGDAITFKTQDNKDTTSHRIVAVSGTGNDTSYQVKGDANETPDVGVVAKYNVVGKVNLTIPYLGYLIAFIRTLPGLIIFIIVPAMIIIAEEMSNIKDEVKRIRAEKKKLTKKLKKEEIIAEKWYKKHLDSLESWFEKNRQEVADREKNK